MWLLRHQHSNSLLLTSLQLLLLPSLISSYRNSEKLERFWNHISATQSGLYDSHWHPQKTDYFQSVRTCLDEGLAKESLVSDEPHNNNPEVYNMIESSDQTTTLLVQVRNALTSRQAQAIQVLANCTAQSLPDSFHEQRSFESQGGNEVTFMNTLLQLFLPDVTRAVYETAQLAYEHAGWGQKKVASSDHEEANKDSSANTNIPDYFPPVQECGLRTTEYLNYKGYENLGEHDDAGSMYTVLFALSAPTDYEGGNYFLRDGTSMDVHTVRPEQYSAIVFLSEQYHGVTSLKGDRRMFTNELWKYDDPPWLHLRPIQESMEHFTEVYEKQRMYGDNDTADSERNSDIGAQLEEMWPSCEATVEWFRDNDRPWTVDGHVNPDYYKNYLGIGDVELFPDEQEAVSSGTSSQGHYLQTVSQWLSDIILGKEIPEEL